ncbi:MAG: hypothetical protein WBM32_18420 [Crocosphaera sp.]|jgi:hypothetical protein
MSQISAFDLANLKIIPYQEISQVQTTQEDVILTIKDLVKKISEHDEQVAEILAHFPETTPFVRLFWLKETVQISIPSIYKDELEGINLYDVSPTPSPIQIPIKWVKYSLDWNRDQDPQKTLVTGTQIFAINHENPSEMKAVICPLGLSSDYIKSIQANQNELKDEDIPKGKGLAEAKYLRYYPRPLLPMSRVEVGETYYVKEVILEQDPRYNAASRYLLGKLNQDEEISTHEVLANYYIRQHYQQFGSQPFVILSKEKKDNGFKVKVGLKSLATVR